MNIILTVVDENAPSDKYPHMGISVDFKDTDHKHYFAEYPNYKSLPFEFERNKTYSFDCCIKEIKFVGSSFKLTRIKNVKQI